MADQNWTLKEPFAYFDAKATNPRRSRSSKPTMAAE